MRAREGWELKIGNGVRAGLVLGWECMIYELWCLLVPGSTIMYHIIA